MKLSKTIDITKRLKYTFPNKILFSLYNSLFIPYIQYGLLLWRSKYINVEKLQKRAIRLATGSHNIAHTEPLFKLYYKLNVKDLYHLKIFKFYYNLYCNRLPQYFNVYHNVTQEYNFSYNLHTRPLRLPFTRHVYAESSLNFQLVKILNDTDKSILQMIENQTHSYIRFSNNVTKLLIIAPELPWQTMSNNCIGERMPITKTCLIALRVLSRRNLLNGNLHQLQIL